MTWPAVGTGDSAGADRGLDGEILRRQSGQALVLVGLRGKGREDKGRVQDDAGGLAWALDTGTLCYDGRTG